MKYNTLYTISLIVCMIFIISFFVGIVIYIVGVDWGGRLILGSILGTLGSGLLTIIFVKIDDF